MNYNIVNLFPTTVYVGEIDNHLKYKDEFYKLYPKYDYKDDENNNTVSENVGKPLLHLENTLNPLFEDIVSHAKSYVYDVLRYKELFDFVITKTWLSRHRDQREIPWHIHATSHISFVYYVNTPSNSHRLKFGNPDSKNNLWWGNKEGKRDNLKMIEEYNELNAESFFISPPEGTVVLFPASLQHATEHVPGFDGERLGIVGDLSIVLKEEYLHYSTGYINPKYWKIFI
tara:strand:- start:6070 stop:6756 length:687 start_codon:yes stop_codon:yes gene_type:complete